MILRKEAWPWMKLGDWVHCTRCIRKTGNHYEVIPAGNTTDSTETALYFEHGAEENAEEHAADQHFRWSACRKGDKETMKHCPCEGCKNSIGGVDCRLNVENECKAGGGYEAWETMPTAQLKPSRSERFLKWSAIVLVWLAYPAVIYKLFLLAFGR